MFNIGDLIFYSTHGICRIDDICEMRIDCETKSYYVLHPMVDDRLTISVPVDNDKVVMLELLTKEGAEEILESFKSPGMEWIENDNERHQTYLDMVKSGNRREVAMIANTLMKESQKEENKKKKAFEKDKKILSSIEGLLCEELAFALNTNSEVISKKIRSFVK